MRCKAGQPLRRRDRRVLVFLKALTLQGFKTFAQRTHLSFEPGITAVVGPNGSGKSNFSDAIRWVLGEQSMRSLRSRRTEDVLFAGGSGRPPAGMAEVTLTFDNSQRWLDVPFGEVTIARRAYRSGENEYYLNRDRVRLRDVADVLGRVSLGVDGFAIVGQGTIDAALSLRPEDRRSLIEQAAAVGHLYVRLDDARNRLTVAQQNLARVSDLVGELTPRLRTLERQARQARERESIQAEFYRGLIRWYAHLWFNPLGRHKQAMIDHRTSQAELLTAAQSVASAKQRLDKARVRRLALERSIAEAVEARGKLQRALAEIEHAAALDRARRDNLRRQRDEYQSLLDQQRHDTEQERNTAGGLARKRSAFAEQLNEAQTALAAVETDAATWHGRRATLEQATRAAHQAHTRAEAQHAAAAARDRGAEDRIGQLDRALADHDGRIATLEAERMASGRRVDECQAALEVARADSQRLADERRVEVEKLENTQAEANRLIAELAAIDRDLHGLRARCDALQQVETAGTGYFAGVRAVLQAANGHGQVHLDGVVGVVAKLLVVSPDKELAIETALGGHLQDVVVDRWVDAEAAIAHLKKTGVGRATFLPLDTLRPSRRSAPPTEHGLLGVASTLVDFDARFRVIGDFLLGQTLVVEDMSVARRILRDCAPFWQIVTLDGEITRPSGAVTGGAPGQTRGTLARHRELRVGRQAIAEREAERAGVAATLSRIRATADQISTRVTDLNRTWQALEQRAQHASTALAEARHQSEHALHGLALRQEELQRLVDQRAAAQKLLVEAERAMAESDAARKAAAESLGTAQKAQADLEREVGQSAALLAAKRSERDTVREQHKAVEAALSQAEARYRRLAGQAQEREAKLTDVIGLLQKLDETEGRRETERARLADEVADAVGRASTLEKSQQAVLADERDADAEYQSWQNAEHQAAERSREAERRRDLAGAELDGLRQQVLLEIAPLDDEALGQSELRAVLPNGMVLAAPIAPLPEPERLRSRIDSLRSRLRNLPVGTEVITEHDEARERLEFLTGQSGDLERTIATLREAIDETRSSMKSRFDETFATVAAGFSRRFVELFGGGTARLVVDGGDELAGIEVIAQPPGKRAESLSMLSGGERALTAAALLLALIEANPPPFCVLDEVDAALDESNVGRFCSALQASSEKTQFIVITHNRRTMEAARTIYGLAVENRCESRVLALQLPTA